jgi:hypothetical protein
MSTTKREEREGGRGDRRKEVGIGTKDTMREGVRKNKRCSG